ncbi:hypothetical protein IW140_006362 [Coemansia sp. RSA 1813]|nr:hypothetical protein LPJ74_006194 [Coemansia sp. RSA 1843]KAJ2085422.1 hypothetical protein IW138_006343 [Coemansia sp. RSA 986]KAJ2562657.1 hypothetical protein IW140_006362 [Coemansia sp. RSA 1813]
MSSKSTDTCGVAAGSTITLEWHEEDDRGSRGIEGEHWGPCLVYLAPLESNGEGSVWFKIFELGYDTKTKDWCIDVFNRQQGKLDIEIPSDIKQGAYLMRTEIIALHLAERVYGEDAKGGAEYYSNCAQLYIIGDGTAEPEGVAIPGVYDKNEPGIHFSLWDGFKSYPIPGPKLYTAGSLANTNNDNMVLDYVDDSSEIEKPSVVEKAPKPSRVSSKSNCVQRRRLRRRRAMERKHLRIKDDL